MTTEPSSEASRPGRGQRVAVRARSAAPMRPASLPSAAAAYDESETISKISENSNTPTTIIVESPHAPAWLRHTDGSVGYRVPKDRTLRKLLEQTGPLVAPSANPQGLEPARTIDQAREYFGESIDCYLDGGEVPASQPPSQIFKIKTDGSIERLR